MSIPAHSIKLPTKKTAIISDGSPRFFTIIKLTVRAFDYFALKEVSILFTCATSSSVAMAAGI